MSSGDRRPIRHHLLRYRASLILGHANGVTGLVSDTFSNACINTIISDLRKMSRGRKAPVFIQFPIPNFQFQSRSYYSQLLLLLPVIVPLEPPPEEGTSLINLEFPFSKLFRKCFLLESGTSSLGFLGRSECGRFKTRVLRNTGGVYADIRRGFPKGDNAEDAVL